MTLDRRYAVFGSNDETLRLWDFTTGAYVRTLVGHHGWVKAVAVTPDERHALFGSGDGMPLLWDLVTGQELRAFTGHEDPVFAVAVSPDGHTLVSDGIDYTVRV